MKRLALALAAALLAPAAGLAGQSAYPVHIERQRGSTLVIEHTPVPARIVKTIRRARVVVRKHKLRRVKAVVRRSVRRKRIAVVNEFVRNPAIAGGCYDGGYVRRPGQMGSVLVLHRDVCEGIAPVSSLRLGAPGVEPPPGQRRVSTTRR